MKLPGPDHPITTEPSTRRMRAFFAGHVIADSNRALTLTEASYKPVTYFPREDVSTEYFSVTDKVTHCPYKGDAAHYTLLMDGEFADNAAWSYEDPFPAMEQIRGMVAFYPDKVEVYSVDEEAVDPRHVLHRRSEIDEAVLHTDSGSGRSQKDHWPPNVEMPPD
jgi:uncharacterized protein (DUF427 family)